MAYYPNYKKRDFPYYDQDQQPFKKTSFNSFLSPGFGAVPLTPRSLSYIEAFLRPSIREEAERQVKAHFDLQQSSSRRGQVRDRSEEDDVVVSNGSRTAKLKLCLVNKIPSTIFTNNQIEAENAQPLQVALWDITTNNYYNLEGTNPLSSATIEFVVLDGEFGSEPGIQWSMDEFNKSIVSQRVGERPLLVGNDKTTRLKNGVALVNDLKFTMNSSRTRTKMIRLGIRIKDHEISNNYPRIEEAVSDAFRVKDHRGEANKKNHPPKGEDEVYRLEGIGKGGERHTRLASKGIQTIHHFVKELQRDSLSLRKLLGKRVSNKQWNEMVKHASEYDPFNPTVDPNSQLMNPTTNNNCYYNGFGGTICDPFQDHHIYQGLCSPILPHVGEASTSNTHHYEVENSNTIDHHFQGPWPRT